MSHPGLLAQAQELQDIGLPVATGGPAFLDRAAIRPYGPDPGGS